MKTLIKANGLGVKLRSSTTMATLMAATVVVGGITPAYATINNTATVTGTPPSGPDITVTDTESVDVEDAVNQITLVKSATINGTAYTTQELAVGDVIVYTYAALNNGNQTLTDVTIADPHDAGAGGTLGAFTAPVLTGTNSSDDSADLDWDSLAPGETVTWTATYTVTQDDITNQVGNNGETADGSMDNTATASATTQAAGSVSGSDTVSIDVEAVDNSLVVAKVATVGGAPVDGLSDNVAVGDVVLYTYTITNDGNVPISDITLADAHVSAGTFTQPVIDDVGGGSPTAVLTNTSGNSTDATTDSSWDVLFPGDVITVTTEYTIVQGDIDTYQ